MVSHFNESAFHSRLLVLQLLVHWTADASGLLAAAVDGLHFANVLAVGRRLLKVLVRLVAPDDALLLEQAAILVSHLAEFVCLRRVVAHPVQLVVHLQLRVVNQMLVLHRPGILSHRRGRRLLQHVLGIALMILDASLLEQARLAGVRVDSLVVACTRSCLRRRKTLVRLLNY